MAFKKGKRTFAHSDAVVTVTPIEEGAPNLGQAFELKSAFSFTFNLNATSVYLKGTAVRPVGSVPGSAEPTWEIGLSALEESDDLKLFLGAGFAKRQVEIKIVLSAPGKAAREYKIQNAYILDSGAESDDASAPADTIGGSCEDVLLDGVSGLVDADEAAAA